MKKLETSNWYIVSEEPFIEVLIEAELICDSGDTYNANIGSSIEVDGDLEYDKSKYTTEELAVIDKFIEDNRKEIETDLTENY
jgi:hypothetical protein